jgi:hypothetical protein
MKFFKSCGLSSSLSLGIVLILLGCSRSKEYAVKGLVHVERNGKGFTLIRNGKPYLIKGVAGYTHLQELEAAGGNTIRTWDTTNLATILDSAQAHNLSVMVGLPLYNSNHIHGYYRDSVQVKHLIRRFHRLIEKFKTHPAVLMWCLGNELNYFYKPEDDFFRVYNDLLKMIHTNDPDHPVTTALLNFGKKSIYNVNDKAPDLDIISINTYGRLSTLRKDLRDFSWFWDGPFIIGEWGINGYWESDSTAWGTPIEDTSTKKAEQYQLIYQSQMPYDDPRFLGSFVFYWGYQHEKTPTWYSFFSDDGAASEAVEAMHKIWGGKAFEVHAPQLEYMLVDNKGARDNIILKPETTHLAVIYLKEKQDSLRVRWEILTEDWYKEKEDDPNKNKIRPTPLDSVLVEVNGLKAQFRAPVHEGPYRVIAWIYDTHGNFATCSTPFYVMK